jgi:hypothetical protein
MCEYRRALFHGSLSMGTILIVWRVLIFPSAIAVSLVPTTRLAFFIVSFPLSEERIVKPSGPTLRSKHLGAYASSVSRHAG